MLSPSYLSTWKPDHVAGMVRHCFLENPHLQANEGMLGHLHVDAVHDTTEVLHTIAVPTLVTAGEQDYLIPARYGAEVHRLMPGSTFHTVEGQGSTHAMNWEQVDAFNEVTSAFPQVWHDRADPSSIAQYWHPVAETTELVDRPLAVRLLGSDVVLFRVADGSAHAMKDLCVHRGAPSSAWSSSKGASNARSTDGRTVPTAAAPRTPALEPGHPIPAAARTTSYHCDERYGLVWVALESPSNRSPRSRTVATTCRTSPARRGRSSCGGHRPAVLPRTRWTSPTSRSCIPWCSVIPTDRPQSPTNCTRSPEASS